MAKSFSRDATHPERISTPHGEITFTARTSARAKRLTLSVNLDGVFVVMPVAMPIAQVRAFVLEHSAWVREQLAKADALRASAASQPAAPGAPPVPSQPMSLEINGRMLQFTLKASRRVKRIALNVRPDGVVLTHPWRMDPAHALKFLRERADWVFEQIERIGATVRKNTLPPGSILLRGVLTPLRITRAGAGRRVNGMLNPDELHLQIPVDAPLQACVDAWLKAQARGDIAAVVRKRAREMNLQPASITLRDARTRWGSCSSAGTISFNWRLVQAPPEVLDYIVVHELAHLQEFNHSKAFWSLVARFCPDYKRHMAWLKREGGKLRQRVERAES
jgi:predicted metal-dependent hydrolase